MIKKIIVILLTILFISTINFKSFDCNFLKKDSDESVNGLFLINNKKCLITNKNDNNIITLELNFFNKNFKKNIILKNQIQINDILIHKSNMIIISKNTSKNIEINILDNNYNFFHKTIINGISKDNYLKSVIKNDSLYIIGDSYSSNIINSYGNGNDIFLFSIDLLTYVKKIQILNNNRNDEIIDFIILNNNEFVFLVYSNSDLDNYKNFNHKKKFFIIKTDYNLNIDKVFQIDENNNIASTMLVKKDNHSFFLINYYKKYNGFDEITYFFKNNSFTKNIISDTKNFKLPLNLNINNKLFFLNLYRKENNFDVKILNYFKNEDYNVFYNISELTPIDFVLIDNHIYIIGFSSDLSILKQFNKFNMNIINEFIFIYKIEIKI